MAISDSPSYSIAAAYALDDIFPPWNTFFTLYTQLSLVLDSTSLVAHYLSLLSGSSSFSWPWNVRELLKQSCPTEILFTCEDQHFNLWRFSTSLIGAYISFVSWNTCQSNWEPGCPGWWGMFLVLAWVSTIYFVPVKTLSLLIQISSTGKKNQQWVPMTAALSMLGKAAISAICASCFLPWSGFGIFSTQSPPWKKL